MGSVIEYAVPVEMGELFEVRAFFDRKCVLSSFVVGAFVAMWC